MTNLWWRIRVWWWSLRGTYREFGRGSTVNDVLVFLDGRNRKRFVHTELKIAVWKFDGGHDRLVTGARSIWRLRDVLFEHHLDAKVLGSVRVMR